jgi:hypothetical protein
VIADAEGDAPDRSQNIIEIRGQRYLSRLAKA